MNTLHRFPFNATSNNTLRAVTLAAALVLSAVCAVAQATPIELKGANEVPANTSAASATGDIEIKPDLTVSGEITVSSNLDATVAHIHQAAVGQNGPVIIPLTKTANQTWSVPAGAKLTQAQYDSFLLGNLYVNVHSASFPGGEIRGQVAPK